MEQSIAWTSVTSIVVNNEKLNELNEIIYPSLAGVLKELSVAEEENKEAAAAAIDLHLHQQGSPKGKNNNRKSPPSHSGKNSRKNSNSNSRVASESTTPTRRRSIESPASVVAFQKSREQLLPQQPAVKEVAQNQLHDTERQHHKGKEREPNNKEEQQQQQNDDSDTNKKEVEGNFETEGANNNKQMTEEQAAENGKKMLPKNVVDLIEETSLEAMSISDDWLFWYSWAPSDSSRRGLSKKDYLAQMTRTFSFNTFGGFMSCWTNTILNALPNFTRLMLFKKDICPLWEHPRNRGGGKLAIPLGDGHEKALKAFLQICVAIISGKLCYPQDVCGVILSLREWGGTITIWNSDCRVRSQAERISEGVLRLFPNKRLRYRPHMKSIRDSNKMTAQQRALLAQGGDKQQQGQQTSAPASRPPGLFSYAAVAASSMHPPPVWAVVLPPESGTVVKPPVVPHILVPALSSFPMPPHPFSLTVPSSPTRDEGVTTPNPEEEDGDDESESPKATESSTTKDNKKEKTTTATSTSSSSVQERKEALPALDMDFQMMDLHSAKSPRSIAISQWIESVSDPRNSPQLNRRSSFILHSDRFEEEVEVRERSKTMGFAADFKTGKSSSLKNTILESLKEFSEKQRAKEMEKQSVEDEDKEVRRKQRRAKHVIAEEETKEQTKEETKEEKELKTKSQETELRESVTKLLQHVADTDETKRKRGVRRRKKNRDRKNSSTPPEVTATPSTTTNEAEDNSSKNSVAAVPVEQNKTEQPKKKKERKLSRGQHQEKEQEKEKEAGDKEKETEQKGNEKEAGEKKEEEKVSFPLSPSKAKAKAKKSRAKAKAKARAKEAEEKAKETKSTEGGGGMGYLVLLFVLLLLLAVSSVVGVFVFSPENEMALVASQWIQKMLHSKP